LFPVFRNGKEEWLMHGCAHSMIGVNRRWSVSAQDQLAYTGIRVILSVFHFNVLFTGDDRYF
jgi:hypothetical protein